MADLADHAQECEERVAALCNSRPPYELPPGKRGWCEGCENYSPRLIHDLCGACRDKLPAHRRG